MSRWLQVLAAVRVDEITSEQFSPLPHMATYLRSVWCTRRNISCFRLMKCNATIDRYQGLVFQKPKRLQHMKIENKSKQCMVQFRDAFERFVLHSISRKILLANSLIRLWVQLLVKAWIISIIGAGTYSNLAEAAYAIIQWLKGRFKTLRLA